MGKLVENLKKKMQQKWRMKRIALFLQQMKPEKHTKILDIGGTPFFWDIIDKDLNIVIFNTEDEVKRWPEHSTKKYTVISGDALDYPFKPNEYDIVFSNSVIEHIATSEMEKFAQIIKKTSSHYWVQTPSKYFPIEAHCNLPFWWFYPNSIQKWWIKHWRKNARVFLANQMQTTQTFTQKEISDLFPRSNLAKERVFGIVKSYSVWK